jgi:hypothetical protein
MTFKDTALTGLLLCGMLLSADQILVKDGKPAGTIWLDATAKPGEKTAAEELQTYLKKMSGAEFRTGAERNGSCIVLATVNTPGIPTTMKKALDGRKDESYLLKTEGGKLYIVGKTQVGTLYGAYGLLADQLNVRWFMPGEEYVESRKDIVLPDLNKVDEPVYLWRQATQGGASGLARASKTWAARNRLQCPSEFSIRGLSDPKQRDYFDARIADHIFSEGSHLTFYLAAPPQKYLKTHPEYFALVNGKRLQNKGHHNTHYCLSNPELQKLVADYICSLYDKYGRRITYCFGAPDSVKDWCECENCRALDEEGKFDVSRRFHTVAQKIAAMVYAKHPDMRLSLWAYANYRSLPKDLKIDPRMDLYFCSHGRCFAHRIDDPNCLRNAEMLALLKSWMALKPATVRLYEYSTSTPMSWTPLEHVLAADLKTFRRMGISGWKEGVHFPDANYRKIPKIEDDPHHSAHRLGHSWLFFDVAGRLTWNPDLDVDAVIADFESKYYGKAYPAMKKFNDLRRAAWDNASGCFGYPTGDSRTPTLLMKEGLKDELLKLLDRADQLAGDDPVLKRRLARDRKYLEVFWIRQNDRYRARLGKTLNAPPAKSKIRIDGDPSDPAWSGACWISDFKTISDQEKKSLPPELKTSVGILSDKDNLYFLILANEPSVEKLTAKAKSANEIWNDDCIEIFLDPRNVANTYYQFVVNSKGVSAAMRQPGKDRSIDFGITAAGKVEKNRYVVELKVPVKNLECLFAPGAVWNVHFARSRKIEDGLPKGAFSIDGEKNHERGSYRTMSIGRALLPNGNFTETDQKTGKLKAWKLKNAEVIRKDGRNVLVIHKGGRVGQSIWDWKGPLGQSPEPRRIRIHFRASGDAKLALYAAAYTDDWSGGKLKRKFHRSEQIGHVNLKPEAKNYTFRYTIKPDQWIGLYFNSFGGETMIESVSITRE